MINDIAFDASACNVAESRAGTGTVIAPLTSSIAQTSGLASGFAALADDCVASCTNEANASPGPSSAATHWRALRRYAKSCYGATGVLPRRHFGSANFADDLCLLLGQPASPPASAHEEFRRRLSSDLGKSSMSYVSSDDKASDNRASNRVDYRLGGRSKIRRVRDSRLPRPPIAEPQPSGTISPA